MKSHILHNATFIALESHFAQWLQTLGYSWQTVYNKPLFLREFLHFLEGQHIDHIENLPPYLIPQYIEKLKQRKKARTTGALSGVSINNHIHTLQKLSEYLLKQEGKTLLVKEKREAQQSKRLVFTPQEIKSLYNACESGPMGMRDTAMLDIYYGCGLRRSEGEALLVKDVQLDRGLLYVRKGKGYKERLVPIPTPLQIRLNSYIEYARPVLLKTKQEAAFFINGRNGKPLAAGQLYQRFKRLLKQTDIGDTKPTAGLHTLRHSIATHLLQSGMTLEDISRFLGHSSLESTQIYTHILNDEF